MTDALLNELARRWLLSARERDRLTSAEHQGGVGSSALEDCLDIDRALSWLLRDPIAVRAWLRTPHPAFYHCTPLQIALGSPCGRQAVRNALLSEAAEASDADARAALVDP